jgi:glycosyltransferase involved in cell wall biosynthesis
MPLAKANRRGRHRVFIGLGEVAGYYRGLERGFHEIGVDARFYDESAHPFGYGRVGFLGRLASATRRARASRSSFQRVVCAGFLRAMRLVAHVGLFAWAVVRYDVFIFGGGSTLLRRRELPILRRLGKRIIWVFTGSDHRPPYLNGMWVRGALVNGLEPLLRETAETVDRVRTAERYADVIVAAASSAQFHKRPFVHFVSIGIATPNSLPIPASTTVFRGAGVRILHCPSDPVSKGTSLIRQHVDQLRAAGRSIDYVEIIGRPNTEVLAALRDCDFVIDELYSDTPMAVFATEAGLFGKPVVVAGYYARQYERDLGSLGGLPPTLYCEPDQAGEAIRLMVDDGPLRSELGRRAEEFVRQRWSPEQVALRYLRLIDGEIPAEWWCDPLSNDYVMGWGLTEALWHESLRAVVGAAGVQALAEPANPALRRAIESVAAESPEEAVTPATGPQVTADPA